MSHFYNKKSYSFAESDQMLKEIKDEMSNFLTKEEAELILNRKYAMIDPVPYSERQNTAMILDQIENLRNMFFDLNKKMDIILQKIDE